MAKMAGGKIANKIMANGVKINAILDKSQTQEPSNKKAEQVKIKFFPPKNSIHRCFFSSKSIPPHLKKV
jgi:hypothetical protein